MLRAVVGCPFGESWVRAGSCRTQKKTTNRREKNCGGEHVNPKSNVSPAKRVLLVYLHDVQVAPSKARRIISPVDRCYDCISSRFTVSSSFLTGLGEREGTRVGGQTRRGEGGDDSHVQVHRRGTQVKTQQYMTWRRENGDQVTHRERSFVFLDSKDACSNTSRL